MSLPRRIAGSLAVLSLNLCCAALAFGQSSTSAVSASGSSATFLNLMQVMLALVVVLGLIALFAWLLRRMTQGKNFGGGLVRVRGGVMLGPKERAVLLEVGDTWIVVGVGGGQVTALHAMPRPMETDTPPPPPEARGFNSWLQQALRDKSTAIK